MRLLKWYRGVPLDLHKGTSQTIKTETFWLRSWKSQKQTQKVKKRSSHHFFPKTVKNIPIKCTKTRSQNCAFCLENKHFKFKKTFLFQIFSFLTPIIGLKNTISGFVQKLRKFLIEKWNFWWFPQKFSSSKIWVFEPLGRKYLKKEIMVFWVHQVLKIFGVLIQNPVYSRRVSIIPAHCFEFFISWTQFNSNSCVMEKRTQITFENYSF